MSKRDSIKAFAEMYGKDLRISVDTDGIAWAGFWIGLGLVIAAAVMKGTIVIK